MKETNKREVFEYDGYTIPPYDPNIPEDERKRLKEAAEKKCEETIRRVLEKYKDN